METESFDRNLVPESLKRTSDGPIASLDPGVRESEDIRAEAVEEAICSTRVEPRCQFHASIAVNQAYRHEYSGCSLRVLMLRLNPANSIDPPAGKVLLHVGGNPVRRNPVRRNPVRRNPVRRNIDEEWGGNTICPHVLIKLLRIRAARYHVAALQHYPLAEELHIGAGDQAISAERTLEGTRRIAAIGGSHRYALTAVAISASTSIPRATASARSPASVSGANWILISKPCKSIAETEALAHQTLPHRALLHLLCVVPATSANVVHAPPARPVHRHDCCHHATRGLWSRPTGHCAAPPAHQALPTDRD